MKLVKLALIHIAFVLTSTGCVGEKSSEILSADERYCVDLKVGSDQTFNSADGCNICTCSPGGVVTCSKKACAVPDASTTSN